MCDFPCQWNVAVFLLKETDIQMQARHVAKYRYNMKDFVLSASSGVATKRRPKTKDQRPKMQDPHMFTTIGSNYS